MITARQSRAARALLGWTQETLADEARISLTALKRLESESDLKVYESTRDQVRRALEGNGIVLLLSDQGEVATCFVFTAANAQQINSRLPQMGDLAIGRSPWQNLRWRLSER